MLIRLKSWLKRLEDDVEKGTPLSKLPVSGTLYVVCHPKGPECAKMPDFGTIDGYIQFMRMVLDYAVNRYGKPDDNWQKRINRLNRYANRLRHEKTRFTGSTKEDFAKYAKDVSTALDVQGTPLPRLAVKKETADNMMSFMKECVIRQDDIGFWYDSEDEGYDPEKGVDNLFMDEIMRQLSNLKMEKARESFDISYYLTDKGYHEHVVDAMNLLTQAAVYMINCRSMRECGGYQFDLQEIDSRLHIIYGIMKNAEFVI